MHTAFTSSGMISAKEWKSGKGTQDEYHIHFIIASMTIIRLKYQQLCKTDLIILHYNDLVVSNKK